MELKEYQLGVLRKLDYYLKVLDEERSEVEAFLEFQRSRGRTGSLGNFPEKAWERLNNEHRLPLLQQGDDHIPARWLTRNDGLNQSVPNICFKVPTGGGKTLLATAALERIQTDYFKRQTGLVLWVVPSDAIYRQTWKHLANREHPYRQMLERASGGRVKLLEKGDAFTRHDVEEMLCIMLLMLPSAARQSKETLRMFRDSGRFTSFFPAEDDSEENQCLLEAVPNLDINDLGGIGYQDGLLPGSLSVKQSLGNTLRLVRPVIILDEGHKAYSDTARSTLLGFNPGFILELSATPNTNGKHQSNVLVSVPGSDLKDEQMIKLPINVINEASGDWQHTLTLAHGKLSELAREAENLRAHNGRYIRPILLIRVERTGKGQEEKNLVHAEHARQYLLGTLGAREEEIRLKTSENDELDDEDLLSENSQVRYIITKDALREGWDCPFAYVLAVLSNTTAQTALTQMIGRVLRQPHAQATGNPVLDECYVFTFNQDVTEAVNSVRRGLEDEGMADLVSSVRSTDPMSGTTGNFRRESILRRETFQTLKIILPKVLHKTLDKSLVSWRPLDLDRDILGELDWEGFEHDHPGAAYSERNTKATKAKLDIRKTEKSGEAEITDEREEIAVLLAEDLDRPFLVRHLLEVIPNPWQAMRILEKCLRILRDEGLSEEQLYLYRFDLIRDIKAGVGRKIDSQAGNLFEEKLNRGDIAFRLTNIGESGNWVVPETVEADVSDTDQPLRRKDGRDLEKSLFEKVLLRDFNALERDVARFIDGSESVVWWYRIPVGRDSYGLQGWKRNKVYPDFLVCLRDSETGKHRFALFETKGNQLKGNDDTAYKKKLFDLLELSLSSKDLAGDLKLELESRPIRLRMVDEEDWQATLVAEGL